MNTEQEKQTQSEISPAASTHKPDISKVQPTKKKSNTPVRRSSSSEGGKPKDQWDYRRKLAKTMVRGKFKNYEIPNSTISISFGGQFPNDPMVNYDLTDNMVDVFPLALVKHFEKNAGYYTQEGYENAKGEREEQKWVQRMEIIPLADVFDGDEG